MVGTERFSKSLAAPSKWPIAKSRSALSAQRVRSSETRLIAPTWISTARRLHSNMPKTSAARNPGPPLLSSCRCHRLVSVSRFLFKLVFSGSEYFRIADHPGETRLSGTPAATTRCLHDRRDCARVPPHPAASHVARPVGGGNPRPERHGSPSGGFPVTVSHDFCFPFTVIFTPTGVGTRTTTLTIVSNDPSTPSVTVQATAKAGKGSLGLAAAEVFNPTVIQSIGKCHSARPLVVSNTGTCDLTITDIAIGGANASDFSLSGLPAFPVTLEAGHTVGSGDLNAVFAPTAVSRERAAQATVTFVSDPTTGATSSQTSALCGEGVRTGARVRVTQGGVPMSVETLEFDLVDLGVGLDLPKRWTR